MSGCRPASFELTQAGLAEFGAVLDLAGASHFFGKVGSFLISRICWI